MVKEGTLVSRKSRKRHLLAVLGVGSGVGNVVALAATFLGRK